MMIEIWISEVKPSNFKVGLGAADCVVGDNISIRTNVEFTVD